MHNLPPKKFRVTDKHLKLGLGPLVSHDYILGPNKNQPICTSHKKLCPTAANQVVYTDTNINMALPERV